jgi:hypothetical protein
MAIKCSVPVMAKCHSAHNGGEVQTLVTALVLVFILVMGNHLHPSRHLRIQPGNFVLIP